MSRYTATIRHHSIASARVVPVGDDLASAKRKATKEFGDDYIGHQIVILDRDAHNFDSEVVASRVIGAKTWTNL